MAALPAALGLPPAVPVPPPGVQPPAALTRNRRRPPAPAAATVVRLLSAPPVRLPAPRQAAADPQVQLHAGLLVAPPPPPPTPPSADRSRTLGEVLRPRRHAAAALPSSQDPGARRSLAAPPGSAMTPRVVTVDAGVAAPSSTTALPAAAPAPAPDDTWMYGMVQGSAVEDQWDCVPCDGSGSIAREVCCDTEHPNKGSFDKCALEGEEGKGQMWAGDPMRKQQQRGRVKRRPWPALWRRAWRCSGDTPDSVTTAEAAQWRSLFATGIEAPTFARPSGSHFLGIAGALVSGVCQDFGSLAKVSTSMGLLIVSKHLSVRAPRVLKAATDQLQHAVQGKSIAPVMPAVRQLLLFHAAVRLLQAVSQEARDLFFAGVAQTARRRLLRRVYRHVHALEYAFHAGRAPASLLRIIERGERAVDLTTSAIVFQFFPTLLELCMMTRNLRSAVGTQVATAMGATVAAYAAWTIPMTHMRSRYKQVMNRYENIASSRSSDALLNHELVKVYGAEEHEVDRHDHVQSMYSQAAVKHRYSLALINLGQRAILATGLTHILHTIAGKVARGTATFGDLVMIKAYMFQLQRPLEVLGTMYRQTRQGLVDLSNMFTLLNDIHPQVKDRPGAADLRPGPGQIEFRDVSFRYPNLAAPSAVENAVLNRFSVTIRPGMLVGIAGPSGCGKTTLGRLLTRMFDPDQGSVRIDGEDLRDVTQKSLRRAIAVVPQETRLFNDTIAYNISYGAFNASPREVEEAARLANAHEPIVVRQGGYHSLVGPAGGRLSGGERQRVSLARALLRQARLIVYDEATSALDARSESVVLAALKGSRRKATTLVIAHRLSTLRDCDTIIVMDRGKPAEVGTHDQLLAKGGLYAKMWALQHPAEPQ
eukprot:TRINITY_DN15181_c0_g1_i1.p1 TRINITY_DN15181_c0_g1~~TRINITY_DN15181_c0_g1_i1.p1  ORF type:complete len:895 (+),score=215.20 TRINITY_DN15181_c0_g1_i1:60-2687(+)